MTVSRFDHSHHTLEVPLSLDVVVAGVVAVVGAVDIAVVEAEDADADVDGDDGDGGGGTTAERFHRGQREKSRRWQNVAKKVGTLGLLFQARTTQMGECSKWNVLSWAAVQPVAACSGSSGGGGGGGCGGGGGHVLTNNMCCVGGCTTVCVLSNDTHG